MELQHLLDFFFRVVSAQSLKCLLQVLERYVVGVVCVEGLEQTPKLLICQGCLHGQGGSQEFTVVDFTVAKVINFFDYIINMIFVDLEVYTLHSLCEFCGTNQPSLVFINSLELLLKPC